MRHIDGHDYKDDPFDFSDELTLEGEPTVREMIIAQYEQALKRTQIMLDELKASIVDEDPQDCLSEDEARLLELNYLFFLGSIEDEPEHCDELPETGGDGLHSEAP